VTNESVALLISHVYFRSNRDELEGTTANIKNNNEMKRKKKNQAKTKNENEVEKQRACRSF
jgi:hypothetical protein